MPMRITKITPQKKRKDRYALFQDETFLIGISQESLLKYGLHVGSTLSDSNFNQLKEEERNVVLRNQALRYLSRRAHSVKELKDKLKQKGFASGAIETVIGDLKQKGYLDDQEFARMYLREEMRLKKSGPLLIKNKLLVKGIFREVIEEVLAEGYDDQLQYENCHVLAAKKLKTLQDLSEQKRKEKLAAYLKQKGFTWDTCRGVFEELF
jgi:regulatory protein